MKLFLIALASWALGGAAYMVAEWFGVAVAFAAVLLLVWLA